MLKSRLLILAIQQKQLWSKRSILAKINGSSYHLTNARMAQIAATEDQMREDGKIDKAGHAVKNHKTKKQD